MSRIPEKMPACASRATASRRCSGAGARGSSFAASALSQVVTVTLHSTGACARISRRMSMSRVISALLVAMAAPKP